MRSKINCLSIDLGAESGRVTGVSYDGEKLYLNELHRFSTTPSKINGTIYTDISKIWSEVKTGIEKGKIFNPVSISIDSWGVDFALLDSQDNLLTNPVHYRDNRTDGMMEYTFSKVSKKEIFRQTGIQFMSINTLYQIMSLVENKSPHLSKANTFLTIPDLLSFWLTGTKVCEFTNATTTQMYNPLTSSWAESLLNELHIPTHIFPEIVQPGTKIGKYQDIPVFTVASHDTGSAVAAVPAQGENFAYISSGTWSLVGVEVNEPVINDSAFKANVTNEGGVYGTFRLLKNVMGLWILQECRRIWQSEAKDYSYNDLTIRANYAQPLRSFISPNDSVFLHSGNHPQLIKDFCKKTSQPVPETEGEIVRCVLESLALAYKNVLDKLLKISGKKADSIYIIGGGSQNELLSQMTANATGLPVIAGPTEATVIGNAVVQLITLGELKDIKEARQLISNMAGLRKYEPENIEAWDKAYARYNGYHSIKKIKKGNIMLDKKKNFKYVNYKWDDEVAHKLDSVDRLVYRSNILGDDQRITNTGGGNTSSKIMMKDPLTGKEAEVLWVKGSGGDLRTSKKINFASLYQASLISLQKIYHNAEVKGVKTEIEDKMVEMYKHTVFNLNPRASSIDTPLHSFIPFQHVDHMHPDSVIAIAAAKNSEKITKEIFGDEIGWVKWQRPGFDLGLILQEECRKNPNLKGLVLGQHGLINWANDDKECYELTLSIIEKAAEYIEAHIKGERTFGGQKYQSLLDEKRFEILAKILPKLRGMISQKNKFIGTIQSDERILQFVNSNDAERLAELGTSCPDHFLRTKIKPLYIDWNPETENIDSLIKKLEEGLDKYRKDYSAYYEECKHPDSPSIRDANPTVILIPGLGMIAWGKNKSESRVTAEFYNNAVEVMRGAEAIDKYISLPRQEAFDIEYWKLEEAKLKRMPPEKEFAREVVLIIGAGSGIGKAASNRLAKEGAHIVCADVNKESAEQTAKELAEIYGVGIGVSGTGISNCGSAIGLYVDVTDRKSISEMFQNIILAYGGIDHIIVTSGIFVPPDLQGKIPDDKWELTYDINVIGPYLVADEAKAIWGDQGLKGSLTITTSVNAAVSKKGSLAYDTSKAAANHLVRELSIELSPFIRVNGLAPATVVEGSSMFPRERVISSLKKYNISFSEDEDTEILRNKLSEFYAQRTLLKSPVTLSDQAEAAYLLASKRLSKTTGQIFSVDGGLHEAFLR